VIVKVDRNYLEINSINELKASKVPSDNCNVALVDPPDYQLNKFLYKQVGKDYRWIDRLVWEDSQWVNYVENSKVKTYVLKDKGNLIGYFEIIFDFEKKQSEIAYFGILTEYFGKKYGGYLLSEAINKSFEKSINRVWVHTCSLDHKNALKNYQARGMKIFKSEKINVNIN
tara:strand:+ start:279 stop:791 length:513 start_codon:yes stop_codon:yes gene_type:complete